MTEAEWLAARDPIVLLDELFPMRGLDSTEAQPRSSKLYLIACARRAWSRLPWCARTLVDLGERILESKDRDDTFRRGARELAEGLTHIRGEAEEFAEIERGLRNLGIPLPAKDAPDREFHDEDEWRSLAHLVYFPYTGTTPNYRRILPADHSLELFREVFPNAYHDLRFAHDWLSRDVVAVARHIYDSQEFSQLTVLADALEEAGCNNSMILQHCRLEAPHIRGCWVLEGILHPPKRVIIKRT